MLGYLPRDKPQVIIDPNASRGPHKPAGWARATRLQTWKLKHSGSWPPFPSLLASRRGGVGQMRTCSNPLQTILMSRMSILAPLSQTISQSHRKSLLQCEADPGLPSHQHDALLRRRQPAHAWQECCNPYFEIL